MARRARRGQPVPEPGPKPSLMERYRQGSCAICGFAVVHTLGPIVEVYGDPQGTYSGSMDCPQCGTGWFIWYP
jgi:hypothetical protein